MNYSDQEVRAMELAQEVYALARRMGSAPNGTYPRAAIGRVGSPEDLLVRAAQSLLLMNRECRWEFNASLRQARGEILGGMLTRLTSGR